jgi:ABC-type nitrate/sulfonate/bicarbonate transport system permease component
MSVTLTPAPPVVPTQRVGRRAAAARRIAAVWTLRILLLVLLLGGWIYATTLGGVPLVVLPPLMDVLSRFVELVQIPQTWIAAAVTIGEMIVGFVLAAAIALPLGFMLSRNALSNAVFERIFAWGYVFPVSLVYPLFLVWAGVGIPSKILFAAVSGFFPIIYNTMKGLGGVDRRYLTVGRAFGAKRGMIDLHIRLGAARPMILAGLRLGIAMVTISVVLAEILGANAGLGFLAQQAVNQFQIVNSYAYILLLVILTSLLLWAMERMLSDRRRRGR